MAKKHRRLLTVLGILLFCIAVCFLFFQYQNKKSQMILDLTAEQKLSDFNTLCAVLDESYPFWNNEDALEKCLSFLK